MLLRLVFLTVLFPSLLAGQEYTLSGKIKDTEGHLLSGVHVYIGPQEITGTVTDKEGFYRIENLSPRKYSLTASFIGYRSVSKEVELTNNQELNFELKEDVLSLNQVVVTGMRTKVPRYESAVIVSTINDKTFERTQSLSVSEGLNFSPGLRLENNCQNCGFTQLRMNGLEGAYSQVLINSRPVFSALAGVYGLEMLPTSMVDRVEVVRGGGSALYGGNAIAGTVNIITKDPVKNSFELGYNHSLINGESNDGTLNINGSVVSEDLTKGFSFYGFRKDRQEWDANGDLFSEITQLKNNTFGFDAFIHFAPQTKLKVGGFVIDEYRRGGNDFDLKPHQSDVAEELGHLISSFNASLEHYSANKKHKISAYSSLQWVQRNSYYGGGGRVLTANDSLTEADILAINAYGNSADLSLVNGFQYVFDISPKWMVMAGSEVQYNNVIDEMPGYDRSIEQAVTTFGNYVQLEWKPLKKITLVTGGRFDLVDIDGTYRFADDLFNNVRSLNVFVPRASLLYSITKDLRARFSYAQGYRAPQTFDEDLHIETVGGAARFIQIDPDLKEENSHSYTASLNYEKIGNSIQFNAVVEGFYSELMNPFILSNQEELPNGISVINKRNGIGASVYGTNVELNFAYKSWLVFQSGFTLQRALYNETEVIWEPENTSTELNPTTTRSILRTPNMYGFFSLSYYPLSQLSFSYSGVITGSMLVPHVIDAENEYTVLKETPSFFDNNIKVQYEFKMEGGIRLSLFTGVQNILNSYQQDFDAGADRDAGYVYGPNRPRTFFFGFKLGFN